MFRDVLDLHGGELGGSLPRRSVTRAIVTASSIDPDTHAFELTVVVPDSTSGAGLELRLQGREPDFCDRVRRIFERPVAIDAVLPALDDLAKLEELIHESGSSVETSTRRNYYDEVARYIEQEIDRLSEETLQRVIDVREIAPGLVHLTFPNQAILAETMLRFQEYYESPRFHSTVFTRDDFAAWYRTTQLHGGFSYHFDWPGFNVPARCFDPFTRGDFPDRSNGERVVLEKIAGYPGVKMVIATCQGGDPGTVRHEVAHGLFEMVPEYRAEALRIISRFDRGPIYQILESHGYAPHTWDDEVQAYLIGDLEELVSGDQILAAWRAAAAELRELLTRYRTSFPGGA